MNSSEDEIPIPSHPVLSEEESIRQIHSDMHKCCNWEIKRLESELATLRQRNAGLEAQVVKMKEALTQARLIYVNYGAIRKFDLCESALNSTPDDCLKSWIELLKSVTESDTCCAPNSCNGLSCTICSFRDDAKQLLTDYGIKSQ